MALGDDLQRLFSWLQTPDLRYREFSGEREMPDWPAAGEAPVAPRVRGGLRQPEFTEPEPAPERDPVIETPPVAPAAHAAEPPLAPPQSGLLGGAYRAEAGPGPVEAAPRAPAEDPQQSAARRNGGRSLDSVFGRLSGTRERLPDPRDRPRQGPGSGSGGDSSR